MQYLAVTPGVNLTRDLTESTKPNRKPRVTKTWVQRVMRDHPEWDWRIVGETASVNGEDAIRSNLTLQVMSTVGAFTSTVAMVNFHPDQAMPFGYRAVVS